MSLLNHGHDDVEPKPKPDIAVSMQGFPEFLQTHTHELEHAGYWLRQLYGPEVRGWQLGVNQFEVGRYLRITHSSFSAAPADIYDFERGRWDLRADQLMDRLRDNGVAFLQDDMERLNTANSIDNPWGVVHSYHVDPRSTRFPYEPRSFQMVDAHPFDLDFFDYRIEAVRQQADQIQDIEGDWPYPGPALMNRIERNAAGLHSILPIELPGLPLLPIPADTEAVERARGMSSASVSRVHRAREHNEWDATTRSHLVAALQNLKRALQEIQEMVMQARTQLSHPRPHGFGVPGYIRTD
jgi:hypothetical protein